MHGSNSGWMVQGFGCILRSLKIAIPDPLILRLARMLMIHRSIDQLGPVACERAHFEFLPRLEFFRFAALTQSGWVLRILMSVVPVQIAYEQ